VVTWTWVREQRSQEGQLLRGGARPKRASADGATAEWVHAVWDCGWVWCERPHELRFGHVNRSTSSGTGGTGGAWRRGVAASRCNDARRARAQLAACGARECTTRRVQPNKRSRREQTAAQEASRGASGRMERAEADALPGTLSVRRSQALPLRVNSRSVGTRTWVRGQRSQEGSCCEDGGGACMKGSLGVDHPWNRGHACMAYNQGPQRQLIISPSVET